MNAQASSPQIVLAAGSHTTWLLLILSVGLASGGQLVLLRTHPNTPNEGAMQVLAGCMLLSAAVLFGAMTLRVAANRPGLEFPGETAGSPRFPKLRPWMVGWLSAGIIFSALATGLFAWLGESPIVVVLWIASILALLIAQLQGVRIALPHLASQERLYLAALAGLLAVALLTSTYKLTTLPYDVDGDFASVGLQARALATSQQHIFAYGWAEIPMIGYVPAAVTMMLFGPNLGGLNASGVIEGLLLIIGVYLLGRDLFQARAGLIAAALLTASYAFMGAGRQSIYIDPVLFLVYAVHFLLMGLREGRGWAIVLSGLFTTLCVQTYYSGRIIVFIVGFILLYLLAFRRRWLWARRWDFLLWVLAGLVALGPMLVVFVRHFDAFMNRTQSVFILNPEIIRHMQGVFHVNTISAMLLEQARRTALMFHYYPDTGTQFGFRRPFLDPINATLFTLGLGYALFHMRRLGHAVVLAWIALGVLTGCFLTANPPFWARLIILLPATALLAALALDLIYEQISRGIGRIRGRVILIAPVAVVLLITWMGVQNWNTYVELRGTYATARTRIARYLADQPPSTRAYLVSSYFTYLDREFEFLVPGSLVGNLTPEQIGSDINPVGSPTLLILTADGAPLLQSVQQKYPGAVAETHGGNAPEEVAFYVFRLP